MEGLKSKGRFAGLMYIIFILLSFLADQFGSFTQSKPEVVLERIASNAYLFRVGLVFNLLSAVFFLLTAWALYCLLKSVNKDLSLLFLILNLVGVGIQCVSAMQLFFAESLFNHVKLINGEMTELMLSEVSLYIKAYNNGFISAQIFFGLWLLPLGYVVYKSKFLAKWLGVILLLDFLAITLWFFQYFLAPGLSMITTICLLISLIAELSLTLYLLIKGADMRKIENA